MPTLHRDKKWILYLIVSMIAIGLFVIGIIVLSQADTKDVDFRDLFRTNEEQPN